MPQNVTPQNVKLHYGSDGTPYPVYAGVQGYAASRAYYVANAARYGYTPGEMRDLFAGKPVPFSRLQKYQLSKLQAGCCSALPVDPRTVKVGDVLPRRAVPRLGAAPTDPNPVVSTIPAVGSAPGASILKSGALVRPHGAVRPPTAGSAVFGLVACVVLAGVGAYAYVKHRVEREERSGPVSVAPVRVPQSPE